MNDCAFAHSGSFCQEFTINLFGRGGRTTGARETGCVRISDNLPERNMVLMKKDTVIAGALPSEQRNYDKLSVIVITLNEKVKENQRGLHRLLNVLLSPTLAFEEKKKIFTGEFGIEMEREMGKETERMCNLSEAIEERGIEKGMAVGMTNGLKQGENLFAALTKALLNAGRTDDLLRAANDGVYRQSLYEEYGIQK